MKFYLHTDFWYSVTVNIDPNTEGKTATLGIENAKKYNLFYGFC